MIFNLWPPTGCKKASLLSKLWPAFIRICRPTILAALTRAVFPGSPGFQRINPGILRCGGRSHPVSRGPRSCGLCGWFLGISHSRSWVSPESSNIGAIIIARWGAYPVVWCLAGEGTMPWYLSKTPQEDAEIQKRVLSELAPYVRATDPHHHPITIHPSNSARLCVE